jgi:hypothetical protein
MDNESKKTLRGILIGDSHLKKWKTTTELSIGHSKKQEDYLKFKVDFLKEVLQKDIVIKQRKIKHYDIVTISTSHKYLNLCYKWLYRPKKYISISYLRRVNNRGVAFWYMDDGSLYPKKRKGKIHSYELVICLYASKREAQNTIKFLKERFNCTFTLKFNKGRYSVRCGTGEAKKFLEQIEQFIPDCMKYKTFQNYKQLIISWR